MDVNNSIGNGGISKPTILIDAVPSSSLTIGNLINNPIDDCQTSSTRDSGCYSSTADELHLMQSHSPNSNSGIKHHHSKQRQLTINQNDNNTKSLQPIGNEPFDKVIINVSGLRFETCASTLQSYSNT